MGVSLASGAAGHVEDNLSWQRQWREAVGLLDSDEGPWRERLLLAYRGGGAALSVAGLALIVAAFRGRALAGSDIGRFSAPVGAVIALMGLGLGALWWKRPAGGPRAAFASDWALCALWMIFGVTLLRQALR